MTCGCNDKCELPKALQINNPGEVTLFHRVDIPASQGDDTTYPPKNGLYRNVLLVYLANNHSYLYNSDGIPTRVDGPAGPGTAAGGETGQVLAKRSDADYDTTWVTQTSANDAKLTLTRNNTEIGDFTANASVDKTIDIEVPTKTSDLENDGATGESTYAEATDINAIWEEIEEIEAASDVTDIVGTYAELEAYDTSKLKDNDIIKVLEDETQNDQITYYRWDTETDTFTLIGAIGPYYTKSEADSEFVPQTRTVNSKALSSNITLTAADVGALPDSTIIPTVNDATLTITQNGTSAGTFTANSATDTTIALTDTTYSDFTGATSSVAGAHGLVPAPTTSDPDKFLKGDGTWGTPPGATYTGGTGIDITGNVVSVDNTVATKSDLPTKTSDLINDGSDNTSTYVEADELATVATSGSYNDLLNKPTIPTVNDATLTIQKNGTTVETFTANSSTNKTANIAVPTKTSDLTNDGADGTSTYIESDELVPSYITDEGTDITLPGTQGGRLSDIKLKGDTTQGAAPTPSYPQTVQTVTGEQTVKIAGKNLANVTPTATIRNVTATMSFDGDEVVLTAPTGGSHTYGYATVAIPRSNTLLNKTCTLSANVTELSNSQPVRLVVWGLDGSGNLVGNSISSTNTISTTGQLTGTFAFPATYPSGVTQFGLLVYSNSGVTGTGGMYAKYKNIQLELGSTATSYKPYQSRAYTINLGKNLLDTTITQPGFINASGNYQANATSQASVFIEVLPNTTYTASATATYRYIGFAEYTSAKTFIGSIQQGGDTSSYSITTTAATKFIRVFYNKSTNITAQTLRDDKAQVEIGSARTDYVLYADKIELCKIGDKQDYIYKDNGTWYLHKETARIVDNGASGWGTSGAPVASGVSAYVHTGVNIPDYTLGYVNMATLRTSWSDWTTGDGLQSGSAAFISNNYYFKISTSIASTVAQLQTFLTNNPLITYYPLATAIDTPITGMLLDDLNAFDQATSYQGNTYITVSSVSPDLPATLSVTVEQESALPVATETSVGVVSVGDGLSITEGGVLSVDNTYSTTEQVVGKWIDGKTLYRVVLSGNITSTTGTYVVSNAYNASTVDVVKSSGKLVNDQNQYMQLGCYLNSSNYSGWFMSASAMTLFFPSAYNNGAYTIVLEYTKK